MMGTKLAGDTFELWDLVSRNIVAEFATEGAALALVREMAQEHGTVEAGAFALVHEDANGDSTTIAAGTDLVNRALHGAAAWQASEVARR